MSTSVSSVVNHFPSAENGFTTTTSGSVSAGATTVGLNSVAGYSNGEVAVFVIDPTDATKKQTFTGTIDTAGVQVTGVKWTAGSNTTHASGATVVDYATATHISMMTKGLLVEHNQAGTHSNITATSITATTGTFTNLTIAGTATPEGWSALGATPDTVTYNGYNNYSLVFNSNDLTDTVQKGMKLKLTRTVTAPTQCTDLESGSSQYFNRASASVAGMTFTDDFVVSAWVKLESYAGTGMAVASRFNGTSGWELRIGSAGASDGKVQLTGYNGAAGNYSTIVGYQPIPLGKWVHIAAQLDMSAFTATTTTSYVMIDGVDTPAIISRAGSNPTALVQAGNLEIGSTNGGTQPFDGKIAQVAIYSAKVTQANIAATISQTLAGNETSLISAYSFNNSINDLNTGNANNLTAQGSALATNADTPFAGGATGTTEYAEIVDTAFSTNTTLTVVTPNNNSIPTSGGVSAVSYSLYQVPYGWTGSKNGIVLGCQLYKSIDQSTSSTGSIAITFDGELFDNIGLHSRASNTSRVTIPTGYDGWYRVTGRLKMSGGTAGSRFAQLFKNGSVYTMNRYSPGATAGDHTSTVDELMYLTAGDYIELYAYVDGGGTYTFQGGCPPDQDHTLFSVTYQGR